MAKIIYLQAGDLVNQQNLPAAVGDGRNLALNPNQVNSLKGNFGSKVVEFNNKVNVVETPAPEVSNNDVLDVPSVPVAETMSVEAPPVVENVETPLPVSEPVVPPILENEAVINNISEIVPPVMDEAQPVIPTPEPVVSEPTLEPVPAVSEEIPVVPSEPVVMPSPSEPVVPASGNVEIVPQEPKNTDYDILVSKINEINQKYDDQIMNLLRNRNEEIANILKENQAKMNEYETKIKDLQEKAAEHLKNAQAAEEIATIAHQNAQNVQNVQAI